MLAWLTALTLSQTSPQIFSLPKESSLIAQTSDPTEFTVERSVRPLVGSLDDVPVFNSNSPELVEDAGI